MKLSYFLFTLIFTDFLYAEITRKQCVYYNNTSNISERERDQDGHNVCWGFVAAALIEEENCITNSDLCGASLSIFDTMRDNWSLGKKNELRDVESAIAFGLDNGICLEQHAPFLEGSGLYCQARELLVNRGVKCLTESLVEIYNEYKPKLITDPDQCDLDLPLPIRDMIDYLNDVANVSDEVILQEGESTRALLNSQDEYDFLKSILIPKKCQNNRLMSPAREGRQVDTEMFVRPSSVHQRSVNVKLKKITDVLESGRSLGLGICSKSLKRFINKEESLHSNIPLEPKICGNHGVIVQGMRWNGRENRCEMKIINSWGEDTEINNWIPAEELISSSYMQIFIK